MILITGGTGLLGSHLIKELLNQNKSVKVLVRDIKDKNQFESHHKLSFVQGDILDISSLEIAFENIEYVYNCAGYISFASFDKKKLFNVNVLGTSNLVNTCLAFNVKKLCHVSSVAAIGKSKDSDIINENTNWDDSLENSYYGYTKYLGELEVWRVAEEGLNVVIVNPSVILGYTKWSSPSMNIFKYIKDGSRYYTEGGNNFVDVKDVVKIMYDLMNSEIKSARFIIAGKWTSYKKLFELIAKELSIAPPNKIAKKWMLGIAWRYEYIKYKLFNIKPLVTKESIKISNRSHEYSSEKVQELLKFSFIPIEDTIQSVCTEIKNKY